MQYLSVKFKKTPNLGYSFADKTYTYADPHHVGVVGGEVMVETKTGLQIVDVVGIVEKPTAFEVKPIVGLLVRSFS